MYKWQAFTYGHLVSNDQNAPRRVQTDIYPPPAHSAGAVSFIYNFSNTSAVQVFFDGKGTVDYVQDLMTMSDLMDRPNLGH